MNLETLKSLCDLKEKEPALWNSVHEWIAEGWGLDGQGVEFDCPSPEQIAAALFMEARTQDVCARCGESSPEYPNVLRDWAYRILEELHPRNNHKALVCQHCGLDVVINDDGTTNHLMDDTEGVDCIDYEADEDHVALPEYVWKETLWEDQQ